MGSWCWKRFTECIRPTKTQEKVPGRSLPSTWPRGDVFDLIKLLKNTDFTIFLHLVYTPNTWLLHKHRQVYWQLATPLEVFIIHHRPWRDHLREGNFGQHYKCIVKGRHAALWTWQGKSYSGYWTHHPDVLEDDPVLHINLWTNWRLTYGFSFDLCPVPSLKKFGTEPTIPPFQPWTFLPAFVRGQQTCLADPSWDYEISFTNFLHPKFYGNPIILETRPRVSGLLHRVRALHPSLQPSTRLQPCLGTIFFGITTGSTTLGFFISIIFGRQMRAPWFWTDSLF